MFQIPQGYKAEENQESNSKGSNVFLIRIPFTSIHIIALMPKELGLDRTRETKFEFILEFVALGHRRSKANCCFSWLC